MIFGICFVNDICMFCIYARSCAKLAGQVGQFSNERAQGCSNKAWSSKAREEAGNLFHYCIIPFLLLQYCWMHV